ncbi:PTS sugar transporter subunit IIB [Collinsella sp. AGMB00827]|uniref:PTS sugar transporter subunit IIB n=1 Tax=Collinsella ureilytica TaxID=2869515 RepID=A0ABS7MJF7_9ACTN|nr:PTS sugar transporter subunit IIB [Collinsella urealyticum]MBY4797504.1 PTS sugar transporter subunit IIB [Collinsella urealyticum]
MKKILLCCNAGMSTSLLVQKMEKEVEARGLDLTIEARPLNEARERLDDATIVLLGPQIAYTKGDFEEALAGTGIPVEVIPMVDYGRMNAAKIIDEALERIG